MAIFRNPSKILNFFETGPAHRGARSGAPKKGGPLFGEEKREYKIFEWIFSLSFMIFVVFRIFY